MACPGITLGRMLLGFLLYAQAAAGQPVYATERVRELVSRAAAANHAPPRSLAAYSARVESEFSLILRDSLGRERSAQIEQIASRVQWSRGSSYDMHVVGYRSESIGSPVSLMSFVNGWTEPMLYGNRLPLGVQIGPPERMQEKMEPRKDTIIAVHPFAIDREDFYRYSGGDTVVVMHTSGRSIPIVRVRVIPHLHGDTRFAAFDGEIDLDAERDEIVRMRGQFVVLGKSRSRISRMPGLVAVAFCEFVNAEIDGRYWLPAFQRTEFQTTFALLGNNRAVMRVVSRFSDHETRYEGDTTLLASDTLVTRHRTTWAPSDSMSRFKGWSESLGNATTRVAADDFDDMGPDAWKPTGRPRVDFFPTRTDNVVRYDRVEGLYTGVEASLRMRSSAPGLTLGGNAGWAWTEKTARGGAHFTYQRDAWTTSVRAERTLPTTNDFIRPLDPESGGLAALLSSIDYFDYVDRRAAAVSVTRILGSVNRGLITAEFARGDDKPEIARLTRGLFGGPAFTGNRGILPGSYSRATAAIEIHPDAQGESMHPGTGMIAHYTIGTGDLAWQRAEASIFTRKYWGPVTIEGDVDAGAVWGDTIPPQQLFELGGNDVLPSYDYKEFAGDRAGLVRFNAFYNFPVWRSPHRLWRTLFVPGLSPGLAAGVQGGWTDVTDAAAELAVSRLGAGWSATPVSRPSNGLRSTVGLRLTFFSGLVHVGIARPMDHRASWRFIGGFGRSF